MRTCGIQRWSKLAAIVLLALATSLPLQAQLSTPSRAKTLLGTLTTADVEDNSCLSLARLDGHAIYLIRGERDPDPTCVIIHVGNAGRDILEKTTRRIIKVYKLAGYKIVVSKNGKSAMLVRTGSLPRGSSRVTPAARVLTQSSSLTPVIEWLVGACGAPQRVEDNRIVWREKSFQGASKRDFEVALSLLDAPPCHVDVRAKGIGQGMIVDILSTALKLQLDEVDNSELTSLRRSLGIKPLATMNNENSRYGVCLVKVEREVGSYRIGEVDELKACRSKRDGGPASLPEVTDSTWADEMDTEPDDSESGDEGGLISSLRHSENDGDESAGKSPNWQQENVEDSEEDETDDNNAPSPEESAMPTPAAAREAFLKRLRAL